MLMNPKKMSEMIREKKKKLLEGSPDVVSSEPHMMNAQDVEDNKQLGRIEATLEVPEKSNSDDAMNEQSMSDAESVGLTDEEKTRMSRLRGYFDTMELDY
jgi:hypothetical protein